MASAKPATTPVGSAVGRSETAKIVPEVPEAHRRLAHAQPEAERRAHVVASARADDGATGEAELGGGGDVTSPAGSRGPSSLGRRSASRATDGCSRIAGS